MSITEYKLNDDEISFEVALEKLGQSRAPFMAAIRLERAKLRPSSEFIAYCDTRLQALDQLQLNLRPEDRETVRAILTGGDGLF